jgi:hypothetical protein
MSFLYSAYGLTLRTPFPCAALVEADANATVEVEVVEGRVPRQLTNPFVRDAYYDVSPDQLLFRGSVRSARFLVENAAKITFEKYDTCEDDLFRHHLLHHVVAALLRQRGLLVLHASSVVNSKSTVGLTGTSGAGKSTTMAALVARGWRMLSDEIAALRLNDDGALEILPGATVVHLHEDAAAALPYKTAGLMRHEWHRGKMAVPLREARGNAPAVLNRLVHLRVAASGNICAQRVTGHQKLPLLMSAIYGPAFSGQHAATFDMFAAALTEVEFISVTRPPDAWTLDAVVEAVSHA